MSYKLSYTAQEVDELLGKVKGGVCLPVVEISSEFAGTEPLGAEECAILDSAFDAGLPCLFKMTTIGISGVATLVKDDGNGMAFFAMAVGNQSFTAYKTEDVWYVGLME